jgi:hypothetical protein
VTIKDSPQNPYRQAKKFSKNYVQLGHVPSKGFANPVLGRKKMFEEYLFKGVPNY